MVAKKATKKATKKGTKKEKKTKGALEVVEVVPIEEKKETFAIVEVKETGEMVEEILSSVPQLFEKAQRNLILNETPRYKIKKRKGKGGMFFDYVDIGYVLEQLNLLTGHRWDFEVLWQTSIEEALKVNQVVIRGELTIHGKDGSKTKKVDYGNQDIKKKKSSNEFLDFGNDMKGALSDCIKRCARQFGVALDVYSGAVARRQDAEHPEATITEGQRRRLEVLAGEAGLLHKGLKKMIFEVYDYTSTTEIQRRHFREISTMLEEKSAGAKIESLQIPEDIQKGWDILGTPKAKRIAVYTSYKEQNRLEELKGRIGAEVDAQNANKK